MNEGINHWRESAPHDEELDDPQPVDTRDR
jgi:hypothetical protein